jgi:multimeric flavodoxin WrbA
VNILALTGSPRLGGNSTGLLNLAVEEARRHGDQVRVLHASKLKVQPCLACENCKDGQGCTVEDDMQQVYEALKTADVLLVSTPVYFYAMSGWLKSILDRTYALFDSSGEPYLEAGKKLVVITSQAEDDPIYGQAVLDVLDRGFAWSGLKLAASLTATGLSEADDYLKRPDLLTAATGLLVNIAEGA